MSDNVSEDRAPTVGTAIMSESDLLAQVDESVKQGTATAESIRESMTGDPKLERIKVVHPAALYELPGSDEGVKEFVGVIVAHTRRNAFFEKPIEEAEDGENRPTCWSNDGQNIAEGVEEPQAERCAVCPRNRAAKLKSAREEAFERPRKEACGNFVTLAVTVPGASVPYQLQFSQSAFKPWDAYIQGIGTRGSYQTFEVVTRFKLERKMGRGQPYSVPVFECVGPLKADLAAAFRKQNPNYLALIRRAEAQRESASTDEAREAAARAKKAAEQTDAENAGL